jgi:hypothetical protein
VGEAVGSYFRSVKMQDAMLFAKVAQYAVMAFVILIALDQIKVGGDIVRESFLVILAGVVFALALAFGLAGKDWAKAQIERWWPRQAMRPPVQPLAPPPPPPMSQQPAPHRFDDRPPR